MVETDSKDVTRREKLDALAQAVRYRPKFVAVIVVIGIVVAVLEGVGLTFIIPIIEIVQSNDPAAEAEGLMAVFVDFYRFLGVPFTLGFVIAGVALVMSVRYSASFLYNWFRRILEYTYRRHLQKRAFGSALEARIEYFDEEGSDDILNAIITEAAASARVINKMVALLNLVLLTVVYLAIAVYVSPLLTAVSIAVLGGITVLLRHVVDPGYDLGDRVADANERRQEAAQAGMQGIRDIRIFDLGDEIYGNFVDAVDRYTTNKIKLKRNESAIRQFYNLTVAVFVFVLVYLGLRFANLSFGELGLFLFVMFQLGPKVSSLNKRFYSVENELPHLVRNQQFIRELEALKDPTAGRRPAPDDLGVVEFDGVWFSYNDDEDVLRDVDFTVRKNEFVAFVGQSGAGKSTIVSLLAQYYRPDRGQITADGTPIEELNTDEWRDKVAVVRQSPYIFNDTLRYNLTVGNRNASQREVDQACEIAQVNEFIDDLPNGYDSHLGDEGVQLSGGQKQRVALARALLKDAELLILDEATSDLDSNLEKDVQRGIEAMERDYAIITIAHRLSTVENADRIYTMENGRISERGDHTELIDNEGKYAELYAIQSG